MLGSYIIFLSCFVYFVCLRHHSLLGGNVLSDPVAALSTSEQEGRKYLMLTEIEPFEIEEMHDGETLQKVRRRSLLAT